MKKILQKNTIFNYIGLEEYHILGQEGDFCIVLDIRQDEKLKEVGIAREVVNKVQRLRKKAHLVVEDDILIFFHANESSKVYKAVGNEIKLIDQIVKKPFLNSKYRHNHLVTITREDNEYDREKYAVEICYPGVLFNTAALDVKKNLKKK